MQLFLRSLRKTYPIDVDMDTTVMDIKKQLFQRYEIPVASQRIILFGVNMENHQILLRSPRVNSATVIHMVQARSENIVNVNNVDEFDFFYAKHELATGDISAITEATTISSVLRVDSSPEHIAAFAQSFQERNLALTKRNSGIEDPERKRHQFLSLIAIRKNTMHHLHKSAEDDNGSFSLFSFEDDNGKEVKIPYTTISFLSDEGQLVNLQRVTQASQLYNHYQTFNQALVEPVREAMATPTATSPAAVNKYYVLTSYIDHCIDELLEDLEPGEILTALDAIARNENTSNDYQEIQSALANPQTVMRDLPNNEVDHAKAAARDVIQNRRNALRQQANTHINEAPETTTTVITREEIQRQVIATTTMTSAVSPTVVTESAQQNSSSIEGNLIYRMVHGLVHFSGIPKHRIAQLDNLKSIMDFTRKNETFSKEEITPYLTSELDSVYTISSGFFSRGTLMGYPYVQMRSLLNSKDVLSMEKEFVQFKNYMEDVRDGSLKISNEEAEVYNQIGLSSDVVRLS